MDVSKVTEPAWACSWEGYGALLSSCATAACGGASPGGCPAGCCPLQVRTDLFPHRLSDVAVTAFFGESAAPAAAAFAVQGNGSAADGSNAAHVLLQYAAQRAATAAAALADVQLQPQRHGRSLFEALEAAGASSVLQGSNELAASSVAVASAWVAAVALSWWLMHGA